MSHAFPTGLCVEAAGLPVFGRLGTSQPSELHVALQALRAFLFTSP